MPGEHGGRGPIRQHHGVFGGSRRITTGAAMFFGSDCLFSYVSHVHGLTDWPRHSSLDDKSSRSCNVAP